MACRGTGGQGPAVGPLLAKLRRDKLARGVDPHEVDVLRTISPDKGCDAGFLVSLHDNGMEIPGLIEIRKKHDHVVMLTKKHAALCGAPFERAFTEPR